VSDENIERVREAFQRSARKPVTKGSRELGMQKMTVWKVLRKRLCFKLYKMRLVQALKPANKVKLLKPHHSFVYALYVLKNYTVFLNRVASS
jgi:hypothetical protein